MPEKHLRLNILPRISMNITPDSLTKKLDAATKDRVTHKVVGNKMQILFDGNVVREIPLGSGQIISSQTSTFR